MSELSRTVTLNDAEQRLARYVARMRYESNRKSGIVDRKVGGQSNEETDLEGIAAEIAFCKYTNAYPDLSVSPRRGGEDCDAFGMRIDVKATRYTNGHLLAVINKNGSEVDAYALMVGTFPIYRLAGWVKNHALITPERIGDMGHGQTYALKQEELKRDFEPPNEEIEVEGMRVTRLHLENFRIHGNSTLKIGDSSFVLIRGRNWAGKSTIGQALSMCLTPSTTGLDPRGTGFASKIKRGEEKAVITADIQTKRHLMQRTVTLSTSLQGRVQRSVCLNDPDAPVAPFEKALERQRAALTVALNSDAFLRMDEKDQKNLLAGLALPARYDFPPLITQEVGTVLGPGVIDFEGEPFAVINRAYKKLFDERTVVNRQVRDYAIPEPLSVPAGADSASLQNQLTTLRVKRRDREKEHDAEVAEAIKAEGERERIRIMQQSLLPEDKLVMLRQVASGKQELDRLLKEKKRLESAIDDCLRELARLEAMPEGGRKCPTCDQPIDSEKLKERQAIAENALSELKEQNNALFGKIKALGDCDEAVKLISKHETTKQELAKMENPEPVLFDFTVYNQSIAEIDGEIEALSGQLRPVIAAEERQKEIADRKRQLTGMKDKAATLDGLVKFFDKDGIKSKLLAEYIGGFEAKLNEVLGAWNYSCALSIEPYSFDVSNARGDVVPVRELSGAERVMFSLAFQCAVSRTAGIGLVVIDEVALFLPELRAVLYKRLWEMLQQGYLEQVIFLVADTSEQAPKLPGAAAFMVDDGTVTQLVAA